MRYLTALLLLSISPLLMAAQPVWNTSEQYIDGTGPVTPVLATGATTGDILILFCETDQEAVTWSGGSETWAELGSSPQDTTGVRLTAHWARASQATPTMPTSNDPTDHIQCQSTATSGVVATGDPWNTSSGTVEATSDTSASITGATTSVDECLIVMVITGDGPDAGGGGFCGVFANGDLTSMTDQLDNGTNFGTGGIICVSTGELATAGLYGATTSTLTDAATKAMMTVALCPTAPAAGGDFTLDGIDATGGVSFQ